MGRHLITGAAGFIGFHLALRLLRRGEDVVGFDNLNDYYDVQLKRSDSRSSMNSTNFCSSKLTLLTNPEWIGFFGTTNLTGLSILPPRRGPLLDRKPTRLYRKQYCRLPEYP